MDGSKKRVKILLSNELINQWDRDRNDIEAESVSAKSHKIVWWKCDEGHSWQARIDNRTAGHGCPYCNHKTPLLGKTDFSTLYPQLVREWDKTKNKGLPEEILPNSHKKVWWKCREGHSWSEMVCVRVKGRSCPYCSGVYANSKEEGIPSDLYAEWDYSKNKCNPTLISKYSNKIVWWECEKHHSWKTSIANRTRGINCPFCFGNQLENQSIMMTNIPKVIRNEIQDVYEDDACIPISKNYYWKCEYGHTWEERLDRRMRGSGCPYCSGRIVTKGVDDLATVMPSLVKEWADIRYKADEFTVKSCVKVNWKCKKCGGLWNASIYSRAINKAGCPFCAGRYAIHGVNDLATLYPDLALDWDADENNGLRPQLIKASSKRLINWKCHKCGQMWKEKINNRIKNPESHNCDKEEGELFVDE